MSGSEEEKVHRTVVSCSFLGKAPKPSALTTERLVLRKIPPYESSCCKSGARAL